MIISLDTNVADEVRAQQLVVCSICGNALLPHGGHACMCAPKQFRSTPLFTIRGMLLDREGAHAPLIYAAISTAFMYPPHHRQVLEERDIGSGS